MKLNACYILQFPFYDDILVALKILLFILRIFIINNTNGSG